jgi:hypothetical protein
MVNRGILGMLVLASALRAQEQPLTLSGTFTSGYYSTVTRGEINQSLNFVPFGAQFESTGYLRSPDFLNFSAEPELNVGPQANEAGFQGGNGIKFRMTFLRKLLPLTFRYSNVQVEDVYFGSLSQLSGYTLKERNKDLGLTLELKKSSNLPATTIDWGFGSVNSTSSIAAVSDYTSQSHHFNVDSNYERGGWIMDGFVHYQQQRADLLEAQDNSASVGSLLQTVTQAEGSARHGLWEDSELSLDGGRQTTSSLLLGLPIDLTAHYARAQLRLFQKRRWNGSVRASYSSNIGSELLAQAAGALLGPGSAVPGSAAFQPFTNGISNLNFVGLTSANLGRGFGLYGSVERNEILSTSEQGPLNANYFTSSGGINYTHAFHWGSLSGEYGREFGLGSVTGQSGTIQGQNYRVSAERGSSGGLQFDGSVHGSDQTVSNAQPLKDNNSSVEGSVADRVVGSFSARVGGGWQWASLTNAANKFDTNGYTARASIEHPRVQLSASVNNSLSNSLPLYGQLLAGLGIGSAILTPLQVIPSDYRALSFTLHANPVRKVEFSALWTRSRQSLDNALNNDFELMNVFVTYHFRRIQIEAGYIRFNQIFTSYPDTVHRRVYIRIQRTARIL